MPLTTADIAGMRLKHLEMLQQKVRFFTACRYLLLGLLVLALLLTGLYGRLGSLFAIVITVTATYFDVGLYGRLTASKIIYGNSIAEGFEAIPDFSTVNIDLKTPIDAQEYMFSIGGIFLTLLAVSLISILVSLPPAR